jgi:uncharacterized repeat protein (TIGR01451 family)
MRSLVVALSLLAAAALPASAAANHQVPGPATTTLAVQPEQKDSPAQGQLTCADLLPAGAFDFEYKQDPVVDTGLTPIALAHGGKAGTLAIDEYDTPEGERWDFTLTGDFVVAAVFAKGGDHGNLFDYTSLANVTADTGLHSPVNPNNGTFFEGSHNTICLKAPTPVLAVEKTPDGGTVAAGSDIEFDITVTNNGPGAAENVTLDDVLPAGFTWTADSTDCTIVGTGANELHCDAGDLAQGATFSVTVSAPTTTDDCGLADNPAAIADADNADPASDSGSMTVTCPDPEVPVTTQDPPPEQQLVPQQQVAPIRASSPQRAAPASARLLGPTRCVRGRYALRVVGSGIRSVVFRIGARRVRATRSGNVFTARVSPSGGVQRITARVTFTTSTGAHARTLRLAVQRCAERVVRPQFTG